MKGNRLIYGMILTLIILIFLSENSTKLNSGDIAFIGFNASNDSFEIITFINIPPKTTIHFTDSEWNGNRFGADENDLVWETGEEIISKGSIIKFTSLGSNPIVSSGTLKNTLRISKKEEAIFAYVGSTKMPTKFLAAMANDKLGYGTLLNTGLDNKSVLTFPKGTTYATYKGHHNYQNVNEYIVALNKISNYTFQ